MSSNRAMSPTSASIWRPAGRGSRFGRLSSLEPVPLARTSASPRSRLRRGRSPGRIQPPPPSLTCGGVLAGDRELAILPAEQVGVEGRPASGPGPSAAGAAAAAQRQHRLIPHLDLLDLAGDRGEPGAHVPQRQARPVGEVAVGRRPEGAQVAARELGERPVAVERRRLAEPVLAQRPGRWCLPRSGPRQASPETDGDERIRCIAGLRVQLDSGRLDPLARPRCASAGPLLRERPRDNSGAPCPALPPACPSCARRRRDQRLDRRLEQGQPPAGVVGRDQVDRHPHHPGAEQRALLGAGPLDVAAVSLPAAGAEGERARVDVLGLGAGDRPRDLGGIGRGERPVQELRGGADPREPGRIDPPAGTLASGPSWCAPAARGARSPGRSASGYLGRRRP